MHSDRPYKENISFSRLTRCQIPYHHKSNSYRISQAVDRLETLKNDYFAGLDNVELELKNKLIDHTSDPEMEVVIESH